MRYFHSLFFKLLIIKMPLEIKQITAENLYESIATFVKNGGHIIGDYDDMKEIILKMIRAGYAFNMDRERLRDAMEDLTYMLCPEDDANKDRVLKGLEYEESDYDSSDEDDDIPPRFDDTLQIEEISNDES
jgi:hypothetical protein